CEHQRRATRSRDDIRHRVSLARAGNAEERLERQSVAQALDELFDRLGLVTGGFERLMQLVGAVGKRHDHGCAMRKEKSAILIAGGLPTRAPSRHAIATWPLPADQTAASGMAATSALASAPDSLAETP